MKRLLLVFLLMAGYLSHAQESQDSSEPPSEENNTLKVTGFSVIVEEVSDSLSVGIDSLVVDEKKNQSQRLPFIFVF